MNDLFVTYSFHTSRLPSSHYTEQMQKLILMIKQMHTSSKVGLLMGLLSAHTLSCVNIERRLGGASVSTYDSANNGLSEANAVSMNHTGLTRSLRSNRATDLDGVTTPLWQKAWEYFKNELDLTLSDKHIAALKQVELAKYSARALRDAIANQGLEVSGTSKLGEPILNLAIKSYLQKTNAETRLGIRFLLNHKDVDVNKADFLGNTPLLVLARSVREYIIEYTFGYQLFSYNKKGVKRYLIMQSRLIKEVLECGGNLDLPDISGKTARSIIGSIPSPFKSYFLSVLKAKQISNY